MRYRNTVLLLVIVMLLVAQSVVIAGPSQPSLLGNSIRPQSTYNTPPPTQQPACGYLGFERTDYATGGQANGVAIADLNNDAHLDIAVTNFASGTVSLLLNDGAGHFAAANNLVSTGANGLAIADFNADGNNDLAVANATSNTIAIWLGTGAGSFQAPTSYATETGPSRIAVGDFNDDHKLDLVVTNFYSNSVSLLLGTGSGTFLPSINIPNGQGPFGIVASDVNRDGRLDFATSNFVEGNIYVRFGNGNGTFQPPYSYPAGGEPRGIAAADLNHDGAADLATANLSNRVFTSKYLNDGNGFFTDQIFWYMGDDTRDIAIADFDGSGNNDLVTVNYGGVIAIGLGFSDGNSSNTLFYWVGATPSALAVGDLNSDGKPDVVTANLDSASATVLLNTCGPATLTPTPTLTGTPPTATATYPIYPTLTPAPSDTVTPTPTATATPICPNGSLNPWAETNLERYPRSDYPAGASDGTYFYALGGRASYINFDTRFNRYNPATGHWEKLYVFQNGFANSAAVYSPLNRKLYVFGGLSGSQYENTLTRIYDMASHNLTYGPTMPAPRAAMAAGYWNGKIYLIGGFGVTDPYTFGAPHDQVWEYDPLLSTWNTSRANIPVALGGAAYGVINGHIYIIGGNDGTSVLTTTYDYNIQANTWTTKAPLPLGVNFAGSATANGKVYVLGGYTAIPTPAASQPLTGNTATQVYDPATDTWTSGPSLVSDTAGSAGASNGSAIMAMGTTAEIADISNNCGGPPPPPTVCPNPFLDINSNIFFQAINSLYCQGVVSGTDSSHYTPSGTASRAQFAKVVTLAFGVPQYTPPSGQTFTDVPPSYFAYTYIESGYHAGILSGFDAATCNSIGAQPPCYGPNRPITRGQLTKLVVSAAHYPILTPGSGQTFTDVPPNNIFYNAIETAYFKGVISGYINLTFRPNNNVRRDEMAQIVYKGVTTP